MATPRIPSGPLVDVAWLAAHLRDANLRVIDLRWYLAGKKGHDEYARGHIPGAVFVDLETEITSPAGPGRHPIPSPAQLEGAMRRAGVSKGTRVVVYDDAGGSIAARLWWLLTQRGHAKVHVLDGGYPAWLAAGGAQETDAVSAPAGTFTARTKLLSAVDRHVVDRVRKDRATKLLDARAPERYRGEVEPVDARAGHIPGALNAPWTDNLVDGRFADAKTLRARYRKLGVGAWSFVICYCGSGVTACHDILALTLAGAHNVFLYEGSWSDWARDPHWPAKKGSEP